MEMVLLRIDTHEVFGSLGKEGWYKYLWCLILRGVALVRETKYGYLFKTVINGNGSVGREVRWAFDRLGELCSSKMI
jgi:hypothetical protein